MKNIVKAIDDANRILIYGAATNGQDALIAVQGLCSNKDINFVVTNSQDANTKVLGHKVYPITYYSDYAYKDDIVVLIATRSAYYEEIRNALKKLCFKRIYEYGDRNADMIMVHKEVELRKNKCYEEYKNAWKKNYLKDLAKRFLEDRVDG